MAIIWTKDGWALLPSRVEVRGEDVILRPVKPPRRFGKARAVERYRTVFTTREDGVSFGDSTFIRLEDTTLTFTDTLVPSQLEGIFTRKVTTSLFRASADGRINARLSDGAQVLGFLCAVDECPVTEVTVEGLPRSSFGEAESAAEDPKIRAFSGQERASWTVPDARRGVAFTLLRPGFHWLTYMPFFGQVRHLTSWWGLLLTALGAVLAGGTLLGGAKYLLGLIRGDPKPGATA
jgi:hypothetical protein